MNVATSKVDALTKMFWWFRCRCGEHDKCTGIDFYGDDDCMCPCHKIHLLKDEQKFEP